MNGKRTKALLKKFEKDSYITNLINWFRRTRPTVYTTVHTVSRSGMSRTMSAYVVRDGKIINLNWFIEKVTGYNRNKDNELRVGGCGMDMGFAVVYDLSRSLFPDGFRRRKGEYHRNNDPSPMDKDGGYALRQEWV